MKKNITFLVLVFFLTGCEINNVKISNEKVKTYQFLSDMYKDRYFPSNLVDKGKRILLNLCVEIETKKPATAEEVYLLTHAATRKFNNLALEFKSNGSEIETVARDNIGTDVEFILQAYGYKLDVEEAVAPRDW